jgi:hypothetical protein
VRKLRWSIDPVVGNRHMVVALLVAPVLALLAWFGVGQLLGERAAPAKPGASYPLLAQSGCRYAGGRCELSNGDIRLQISVEEGDTGAGPQLYLSASHALQGAQVAIVASPETQAPPLALTPVENGARRWQLALAQPLRGSERLRIAVRAADSLYFAETETTFVEHAEAHTGVAR